MFSAIITGPFNLFEATDSLRKLGFVSPTVIFDPDATPGSFLGARVDTPVTPVAMPDTPRAVDNTNSVATPTEIRMTPLESHTLVPIPDDVAIGLGPVSGIYSLFDDAMEVLCSELAVRRSILDKWSSAAPADMNGDEDGLQPMDIETWELEDGEC